MRGDVICVLWFPQKEEIMLFIMHYWYLWVIGLIVMPIIALLPQINNIREVLDRTDRTPRDIAKLFLHPGTLIITIIGAMGTFVCSVLFFVAIVFAIIQFIKS